uniref:FAF domain-containing protein n=1 Tax=Kalanchoe fedtschenkoi TaxID=63787 RepID=A0A7N0UY96_KALFE
MSSSLSNSLGVCASFAAAADEVTHAAPGKPASLRRTLSADMSSKTWSMQTGFDRITSAGQFPASDEVDGKGEEKDEENRPSQIDIWTSILSQKNESHSSLPPPYVHPLVKRSASTLSEKSLEICTESLGSETGSDVFSSFPSSPSEAGDEDKEAEKPQPLPAEEKLPQTVDSDEIHVAKYNCAYHNKKSSGPRSFPPPLPSLSRRDGASVHMHSRRENGRLVLAAVSIPTQNNFHAQRQDGRLLLTFVNENKSGLQEVRERDAAMGKAVHDHKEMFNELVYGEVGVEEETKKGDVERKDGEGEEDLEEVNTKTNMKLNTPMVAASGRINVHRPTFVVNKLIRLTGRNTSIWTNKFNEVVKVEVQAEEEASDQLEPNSLISNPRLTTLIPPTQPSVASAMAAAAAASTFNAYEYCWRRKPSSATAAVFKTSRNEPLPSAPISNDNNMFILTKAGKDSSKNNNDPVMTTNFLVVKGNKGDEEFIVPYFKGCKEPRRSLLFREPRCIATS